MPSSNLMSTRLALFTVLPAVDGTLFSLGAAGAFANPVTSTTVGLTVIAGAGSWLSAREEFGPWTRGHRKRFLLLGLLAAALAVAAGAAGAFIGAHLSLVAIPIGAAVALALLGVAVAGAKLPQPLGLPLPAWSVVAAVVVEVALAWTL
ncbi:MAG TPA: hypothetical protein VNZ52_09930 [Candidatus Thermoplasmatota archaeon]|nr:hypothetical protein [Candidatus Thermoplasmatota archaeon]